MSDRASSSRADAAILPWYRQRWPWLLIGGPGIVVLASLASAWLAVKSDDGVVAEDYYKQGLLINRKLAQLAQSPIAAPAALVTIDRDGEVRVRLRYDGPAPIRLRLTLKHPGGVVTPAELAPAADGEWSGRITAPGSGRWIIALESDRWRLPVTTVAGPIRQIALGDATARW